MLAKQEDVFSYRPPPSRDYGRSFEYFADGYRERNDAIFAALATGDSVAVVADIENFYPSVDGMAALEKLLGRFAKTALATPRNLRVVESAARRAISVATGGLQVGLELSHALASVYLHSLDSGLRLKFPSRYFRYVDDVVMVVKADEVDSALSTLDCHLGSLGLKRNPKKDSIADAQAWQGYQTATMRSVDGGGDCLRDLKFRIKLYLARNPDQLGLLGESLRAHDIYLPLDQLMFASRDADWRRRVVGFFKNDWRVVLKYRSDRVDDVVSAAKGCRNQIMSLLDSVISKGVAGDPLSVSRRWQVQGARFAINRALYFSSKADLVSIVQFTQGVDELFEARVVCEALNDEFSGLALTPGPAVAAATQLLALRQGDVPEAAAAMALLGGAEISADLEVHIALRGLGEPADDPVGRPNDLRGLVAIARGERVELDGRISGYGHEVSSLATNFSSARAREIAQTRLMSAESIVLDALSLDSGYGS
ncbi:RNA-directed DNA polymerase [Luteimonas sp. MC1782]|uniref:reverse transcriptase domain-containing protein n=1 Tax=Luteimonas sp. MC1782 TaxID=2760305 RepID=UPI001601A7F6|nr:RNA-directed DNA polymerase [Luteimonas sp. MC1782]